MNCTRCPFQLCPRLALPVTKQTGGVLFIIDTPSSVDTTLGEVCSDFETSAVMRGLVERAGISNYYVLPIVRCVPPDLMLELNRVAVMCCHNDAVDFVHRYKPSKIFFLGKEVDGFMRSIIGKCPVISHPRIIASVGGGINSPLFRMALRKVKEVLNEV